MYLPLLPGTLGHEERSGGACWPEGCAPLLRLRAAREGLASLLPKPQALSSIKPAVALPAELRRCACERRRSGRRTPSTEACFGRKMTATQLQRCRLFPLHYGICYSLSAGWRPPLLCCGSGDKLLLQALYTIHLPIAERACRLLVNALCTTCASRSTALACAGYVFDMLGRRTTLPAARLWCAPVLPSPPARAYTMLWLGAVSCLKLRGAGGVCAGLPCSRRGPRAFFARFNCPPAATATLRTSTLRAPARNDLCPSNRAVDKAFRQSQYNQPSLRPIECEISASKDRSKDLDPNKHK